MIRDKIAKNIYMSENWSRDGRWERMTQEQRNEYLKKADYAIEVFKEYIKEFEALRYCREECGGAWDLQDSILEGIEKENDDH